MKELFGDAKLVAALTLCMAVALLDGFEVIVLGLMAPAIGRDLNIALPFFTWIFFATSLGTIFGSILSGLLGDRYGRRTVLILASCAMAVGMIGDGLSPNWHILLIARAIAGLGIGAVLPAGTSLIAELAPSRFRAALISIVVVSTTVGSSSTAIGIRWLERVTDWRGIFIGAGIASAAIALLMLLWLPESPAFVKGAGGQGGKATEEPQRGSRGASIKRVFADGRAVGAASLCLFFFAYYIWLGFHRAWGSLVYGSEGEHFAAGRASMAIYGMGVIAGAILAPILATRWNEHAAIKFALAVGFITLVMLAVGGQTSGPSFNALWFVAGCALYMPFQLAYGVATSYFPASSRSMGVALAAVCGRLGSLSGPRLGGALVGTGSSVRTTLIAAAVPIGLAFLILFALQMFWKARPAAA